MRTLSSTLLQAQKGASRAPVVKALFDDYRGDRPRLRFTRYYTGAEAQGPIAAAVAGDGSLVRARIDPGTNTLYVSRVASPGAGSTYSSWTSVTTVSAGSYVALAASGANVWLFYVTGGTGLKVRQSSDNGATFGGEQAVLTAGAAVTYLAAAFNGGGDVVLFWNEGATVYRSRYTGTWGARTAWTNSAASVTGLAVEYQLDWSLIVCGTAPASTDPKAWSCIYGDGFDQAANTWSVLKEITTAVSGSNVSYLSPAAEYLGGVYRGFFVEKYTGTVAYSRLHWTTLEAGQSFAQELWHEPEAFAYTGDYGVAAAASASGLWLAAAAGVWFAASPAAAFDASADVLEAAVDLERDGGQVRLVLDNSHGRFKRGGADVGKIGLGRRLRLSFGMRTSSGAETSDGPGYWVTAVTQEWSSASGRGVVVVEARDAWHWLESWRARRQLQWSAGSRSVGQLLDYVLSRAGLEYSGTGSSALSGLQPAFTIAPGESGATAVKRLLAKVPDRLRFAGAAAAVVYPQASDSSAYTYGTDHQVMAGRWRDQAAEVNRARVFGAGVFDEAFDFAEAGDAGELVRNVNDLNLTSGSQATDRAGFELRAAALEAADRVSVPMNVGQELWDVVTVSDAVAGVSAEKRRVVGLGFRYQPARGACELGLALSGV